MFKVQIVFQWNLVFPSIVFVYTVATKLNGVILSGSMDVRTSVMLIANK